MNPGQAIAVAALVAALVGARLGLRRLAGWAIGTAVAAALTPTVGPVLSRWSASRVDWDGWIREIACWAASYALIAWLASLLVVRILGRGKAAGDLSFRGRLAGAAAAAAGCGVCAWLVVGDLAEILVRRLPAGDASPVVAAVRKPLEVVRACRLLATISAPEAELLLERGDIQAVLESESLDRLLRTPGVVRQVSRAAEGDFSALAVLARDPAVSELIDRGDFLDRIRAVDMVAMADDIRRRRAAGPGEAARTSPDEAERTTRAQSAADRNSANRNAVKGRPPAGITDHAWVRRLAEDRELRDRLAEELRAGSDSSGSNGDEPAQPIPAQAGEEEIAVYWRNLGAILDLADGPNLPCSWLPGLNVPPPPSSTTPQSGP